MKRSNIYNKKVTLHLMIKTMAKKKMKFYSRNSQFKKIKTLSHIQKKLKVTINRATTQAIL